MRTQLLIGTAVLALSFGLTAANAADKPAPGSKSEAVSATKDKLNHAIGVVSAEMTSSTDGFVTAAAMSDMYEVQAASIATSRTHNKMVSEFARTMTTAHTKTTDQLKSLLAKENIKTAIPASLDTRHQSLISDLNGASDADFDGRYMAQQVDAHNEALIVMRGYHKSGDNKALKKFAGTVENAVKMHLSMATRVSKNVEKKEDQKSAKH